MSPYSLYNVGTSAQNAVPRRFARLNSAHSAEFAEPRFIWGEHFNQRAPKRRSAPFGILMRPVESGGAEQVERRIHAAEIY